MNNARAAARAYSHISRMNRDAANTIRAFNMRRALCYDAWCTHHHTAPHTLLLYVYLKIRGYNRAPAACVRLYVSILCSLATRRQAKNETERRAEYRTHCNIVNSARRVVWFFFSARVRFNSIAIATITFACLVLTRSPPPFNTYLRSAIMHVTMLLVV